MRAFTRAHSSRVYHSNMCTCARSIAACQAYNRLTSTFRSTLSMVTEKKARLCAPSLLPVMGLRFSADGNDSTRFGK